MTRALLLAAVVLASVMAFSSRAVYMDEHIYLQIARSAQTNWAFPSDTPGVFFGMPKANFADHTHPPVGEYFLAFLYAIVGEFREVPFRLAFSIFAIMSVLAFYALARRFTAHPLWVSLLFAFSPAFFVYSSTLMLDIPMLAFLLAGIALYFEHVQGRRGCLAGASLCFVLAAGTGYAALVPLGCLFLGLLAARRPWQELAAVAAAPAVVALWLGIMTLHFGEFPLTRTAAYFASQGSRTRNVLATFSFLGGVLVFPWALAVRRNWSVVSFAVAASVTLLVPWPSLAYRLWYILLASFGVVLLIAFGSAARRLVVSGKNSGEAFLILWVAAILLFFAVIADMINARYILVTLPAFYLVLFRETGERQLKLLLVPTAALSLIVAYADFRFVNSYRDFVKKTVMPLERQNFRVWSAAESGLRFYLEQTGASTLTSSDLRPAPVDLILRHAGLFRYSLAEKVETVLTVLKTFTIDDALPVRTFNATAGAGLHDSRVGIVPFTISRVPLDRLEIAQVSPLPGTVWSPAGPILKQIEAESFFPMKVPANTAIEYDLDGEGSAELTAEGVRLKKGTPLAVVWRNFRIVPKQFATQETK